MADTQESAPVPVLAGRWQIPLAIVALGVCIYAGLRLRTPPEPLDFDHAMESVQALASAGRLLDAADAATNLLHVKPALDSDQEARIYDALANIIYQQERDRVGDPHVENLNKLIEYHKQAIDRGLTPSEGNVLRAAFAREQMNDLEATNAAYREAITLAPTPAERRTAIWFLARRLGHGPDETDERGQLIHELLDDASLTPTHLWWALRTAIEDALGADDTKRARELLETRAGALSGSDYRGFAQFLDGLVLMEEHQPEQVEPIVAWVREWCDENPHAVRALAPFGHLPTYNTWLSGRVHLALGRSEDALKAFESVVSSDPLGDLLIPAHMGRAQALAQEHFHPDAQRAFDRARQRLEKLPPGPATDMRQRIVRELREMYRTFEGERSFGDAAGYLERAFELIPDASRETQFEMCESIGKAYLHGAATAAEEELRGEYHEKAGIWLERAAERERIDNDLIASLRWTAALEYDLGGRLEDARRLLAEFVVDRPKDERRPAAMLQLGRVCEALNALDAALDAYRQLVETYPQLEEAHRASVLSAGVLMQLGEEHYDEAQAALDRVLTSDLITPNAEAFRDAQAQTGELLYRRGRYSEAIASFEEFLDRYPTDSDRGRIRLLLANAYRRSASQLRSNPPVGTPTEAVEAEATRRFSQAAERFQRLIDELEATGISGAAAENYRRLATFYIADCRLEMNDADSLTAALATYRGIAARYESHPASLVAQVQIANIHLRLGNVDEAARAVERARWLLRAMSDDGLLAVPGGATRAEWERFLTTVAASKMFRGELADAR